MMKVSYTITFEFEHARSITKRGFVIASSLRTAAARVLDQHAIFEKPFSILVLLVPSEDGT